jgi:hypothetical protein
MEQRWQGIFFIGPGREMMAEAVRKNGGGLEIGARSSYCLSKTAVVAIGLPSAPVPFVVVVIVFPSAETTVLAVVWYFPLCIERSSLSVLSLIRLIATVSQLSPEPVTLAGLPSYFALVTVSILDPSARSPLAVILTPLSMASRVTIRLAIGDTPGAAFDFAVLYFHVPNVSSAAKTMVVAATKAKINVSALLMDSFLSGDGTVTQFSRPVSGDYTTMVG